MSDFFDMDGKFKSKNMSMPGSDILSRHAAKEVGPKVEGFYQPQIIYNREVKVGFHKEKIPFIFTCPIVFLTKEEAIGYVPYYVKTLLASGDLPSDVVLENSLLNEERAKAGVISLKVGELEKKQ